MGQHCDAVSNIVIDWMATEAVTRQDAGCPQEEEWGQHRNSLHDRGRTKPRLPGQSVARLAIGGSLSTYSFFRKLHRNHINIYVVQLQDLEISPQQ